MFCKFIPTYTEFWNTGPLEDMAQNVWKTIPYEHTSNYLYIPGLTQWRAEAFSAAATRVARRGELQNATLDTG